MVIAEFFIPHGHCYLWKPELVGLHIVSDALTAVAYYSIPLMLTYFVVKRRDVPFNWIFLLFGAFIVSCGTTHIVEIWTLWHPDYWLSGLIKAFTAVVSLYTASELVSLLPQALAMPSAAQFEAVKNEIKERLRAEAELQQAIAQLKQEMAERRQAEEALRESEERLQLALEGSALGWWDWDITTGQTYFDSSWKRMLGYEVEEIENNYQSWERLMHPQDKPRVMEVLNAYLRDALSLYEVEFRMRSKSGQWKWILIRGKVCDRDESGAPLRMLGTQKDISDAYRQAMQRKLAEERLKHSEANLATAQKIAHIGNWEFDVLTGEITWSEEKFHILGLDPTQPEPNYAELIEKIHPDDRELFQQATSQALALGTCYELDYRIVRPDGQVRHIEGRGEAVVNEQGQVIRLFGTALDITDRKRVEEALHKSVQREREKAQELELTLGELRRTQAQLIQNEKMSSLGQMVAGVAHEINNPVSFIKGNLTPAREYFQDLLRLIELYQQTYPNSTAEIQHLASAIDLGFLVEDWSKLMDSMQVGAQRIEEIVRSLKSFSRLDESELKLVDIHEGIDNTLLILQHRLRSIGGCLEIEVIKNYGQLPHVLCYASQLNQVFLNLLNNAIDALENQSPPRVITISTSLIQTPKWTPIICPSANNIQPASDSINHLHYVIIRIADNGAGMSEEVRQQIFDPFFTTKPIGSGSGLGLSISHQIVVEKHKGRISCISAPEKGTEFIVEIPVTCHRDVRHNRTESYWEHLTFAKISNSEATIEIGAPNL